MADNQILNDGFGGAFTTAMKDLGGGVKAQIASWSDSSGTDLATELKVLSGAVAMQTEVVGSDTYQGWAVPGTATSAASWRVKKITDTTGNFSITWADGNSNFDNVWDNRAILSYS